MRLVDGHGARKRHRAGLFLLGVTSAQLCVGGGWGCQAEHTSVGDEDGSSEGTDGGFTGCTAFRAYYGQDSAVAYGATRLPDGGYALGGYADGAGDGRSDYDAYIVRTDECGEPLWTRNVDTGGFDYFEELTATAEGDVIAVGYSVFYETEETDTQALVVRFDPEGSERYRLLLGDGPTTAHSLVQTSAGVTIVAGGQRVYHDRGYGPAAYLAALSDEGDLLWQANLGAEHLGDVEDLVETGDGGLALALEGSLDSLVVVETSAEGVPRWSAQLGHSTAMSPRIEAMEGGGFLVTANDGEGRCRVVELDDGGNVDDEQTLDGVILATAPAPSGGFLLAGWPGSSDADSDALTIRLDASGDELWRTTFDAGENRDEVAWAVIPTPGGGVTLAGEAATGGYAAEGPALRAFLLVGDSRARLP